MCISLTIIGSTHHISEEGIKKFLKVAAFLIQIVSHIMDKPTNEAKTTRSVPVKSKDKNFLLCDRQKDSMNKWNQQQYTLMWKKADTI